MKKNNLSVFTYYPVHSVKSLIDIIPQFFRNIRFGIQRMTRGYCDRDVWDLDCYLSELLYQTLNKLADTTHGVPLKYQDNMEGWSNHLKEIAQHFQNTQEGNLNVPINKEIEKCFNEMYLYELSKYPHMNIVDNNITNEQYRKLKDNWMRKEEEAGIFREKEKDIAFDMLKDAFFNLWD